MITVDEIMISNVHTLQPSSTVAEARDLMATRHIHHIPILDKDAQLVGLVSQRDVLVASHDALRKTGEAAKEGRNIALKDIMTTGVATVGPQAGLRQAAIYLSEHKYGCLPVVNEGKLVGIVTDTDFISVAVNLLEQLELQDNDGESFAEEPEDMEIEDLELPVDENRDWD